MLNFLSRRGYFALLIALSLLFSLALRLESARSSQEDQLVISLSLTPRHLNGAVQSGLATGIPSSQIFASPLRYDENWDPQPYLAHAWDVSDDGLMVTLDLVEDATFHDGMPVTSADVAFSLMAIKEHHPFSSMFAPLERVDTPTPHRAVLHLSSPHPALTLALSPVLAPVLPKHIFDDGQDLLNHPANAEPIGSGPFMVVRHDQGEAVYLKKNPNFFIDGYPKLDEIIIRFVKDPLALLLSLENGESDLYGFMAGSQEIRRLEKAEHLAVSDLGYAAIGPINWLAFNVGAKDLSDKRVRQAIAYAIDREFIVEQLHRGVSKIQRGPIIESSPFFDPTINAYDLDLDKARALLAEAGYEDGLALTVDFIPGPPEQQRLIAEYLKAQLKKVGIDVTVRAAPDFSTWSSRIANHDFDMTMDAVFNWADPVIGVHRTFSSANIKPGVIWSNTQQYANAQVDRLLEEAAVEQDPTRRKALYSAFQHQVAEDLPIYWINALPYHTAYDKALALDISPIWGLLHPLDRVYWKDE